MPYEFQKPALTAEFYAGFGNFANADTMETHHTKHHEAYVTKLNAAIAPHAALHGLSIGAILENIDLVPSSILESVIDNGGGHANHTLFWSILKQGGNGGAQPTGDLASAIDAAYGNFGKFQELFNMAAANLFGSGWVWLGIKEGSGSVQIMPAPNQNSPLMEGLVPILGLDLWEHAYYLTHKNKRPDYIAAFWNYVDWQAVGTLYDQCVNGSDAYVLYSY